MRRSTTKGILAAVLALAAIMGASRAHASDYCPPACSYVWVTVYIAVDVPYTRVVTLYDHCGRPYEVEATGYRTVRVPVRKRVAVCE